MIDKFTTRIRRYPFQTGIIVGCLLCLLLVGFINLFQDNGRTLAENAEIIQEDYLRMTISEYGVGNDDQLAGWRYNHLGRSGSKTLKMMAKDETIDPQLLVDFTDAIGEKDVLSEKGASDIKSSATPAAPRKGISAFGKTLLVILGLLVVSAAGLYAATLIKTRKKQQRRDDFGKSLTDEPMNVITPEKARMTETDTPDTLFDLDRLFPQKDEDPDKKDAEEEYPGITDLKEPSEMPIDNGLDYGIDADAITVKENKDLLSEIFVPEPDSEDDLDLEKLLSQFDEQKDTEPHEEVNEEKKSSGEVPQTEDANEKTPEDGELHKEINDMKIPENDAGEEKTGSQSVLDIEPQVFCIDNKIDTSIEIEEDNHEIPDEIGSNEMIPDDISDQAEKPLVEIDSERGAEDEDELLKMIRGSRTVAADSDKKTDEDLSAGDEKGEASPDRIGSDADAEPEPGDTAFSADDDNEEINSNADEAENTSDVLIHYQSSYRIGNDMYDEVFSIDQGDVFRGECGIGIGETLNNTEPKAVTAFEIWLFDKDDIHTSTSYLVSDFGLNNEGILERLQQHGKCERIRNNGVYVLGTETLQVEIRVLELEYGNEMEEKNSYFTNVTFDVIARSRINRENE